MDPGAHDRGVRGPQRPRRPYPGVGGRGDRRVDASWVRIGGTVGIALGIGQICWLVFFSVAGGFYQGWGLAGPPWRPRGTQRWGAVLGGVPRALGKTRRGLTTRENIEAWRVDRVGFGGGHVGGRAARRNQALDVLI